jgi:hypothetical protein
LEGILTQLKRLKLMTPAATIRCSIWPLITLRKFIKRPLLKTSIALTKGRDEAPVGERLIKALSADSQRLVHASKLPNQVRFSWQSGKKDLDPTRPSILQNSMMF